MRRERMRVQGGRGNGNLDEGHRQERADRHSPRPGSGERGNISWGYYTGGGGVALWRGGRALGATWGVWGGCIVGMHVQVCEYLPSRVSLTTKQRDLIKAEEWGKRKRERIFFFWRRIPPHGPGPWCGEGPVRITHLEKDH